MILKNIVITCFFQFLKRGYPRGIVQSAASRAIERDRNSLFKEKQQPINRQLCVALEFTPQTNRVIEILKRHWHIVTEIPGCEAFPQIGFKKMSSLRQFLVKADALRSTDMPIKTPKGHYRCGVCSICLLAVETKVLDFPQLGFEHKLQSFTNCKTPMCVYLLTCKCLLHYVRSTSRPLKVRIQEHLSRLRHNVAEAPLVQHFSDLGHKSNDFNFVILETIKQRKYGHKDLHKILLQREIFWISRLNTLTPNDLNLSIDYSVFL